MPLFAPFSQLLDLLLPPRCISCQEIVLQEKSLCVDCWSEANFITAPFCSCCGLPFEIDIPDQALCLDCARAHPPFKTARTVFPYDDFSKGLILAFKHGDRTDLAPTMAAWMRRSAAEMMSKCDLILPVPLHWRRLGARRYNQAALLCHELAKLNTTPCDPNILKRIRHTPSQGHLSRMARQRNLQAAFQVTQDVTGRSILLVDDVLTTGATILNCTNVLLKAGAKEVHVLTFARVIQNQTQ